MLRHSPLFFENYGHQNLTTPTQEYLFEKRRPFWQNAMLQPSTVGIFNLKLNEI